ncbi:Hypothetical protein HVR_LOCUS1113 [uncultured virus]|nr:Hypothetical protein HVR_LOCUS1113 [uncultured virus]
MSNVEITPELENPYPGVEEIQPYVGVGPSPEYSITVHKSTFDGAFITATIIFGLILLAVVITVIILAYNVSIPPPVPQTINVNQQKSLTVNSNYGAVPYPTYKTNKMIKAPDDGSVLTTQNECLSYPNTEWINDSCRCKGAFYGKTCAQEKYSSRYFAVGVPDESTLGITVIDDIISNGKSFNPNGSQGSCSDQCDKTPGCHAFIYHQEDGLARREASLCTLLTNDVIVPKGEGISYSNDIESTLYMTTSDRLQFENRVFLGAYTWSFPARYWLTEKAEGYAQLVPHQVTKINFFPEYIKIYGRYTGIYCLEPFSIRDIPEILQYGNSIQCYIHHPDNMLNLPPDWKYKTPLYVTYI